MLYSFLNGAQENHQSKNIEIYDYCQNVEKF